MEVVDAAVKSNKLFKLLEKYHSSRNNRILIFVLYKKEADGILNLIRNKGYIFMHVYIYM